MSQQELYAKGFLRILEKIKNNQEPNLQLTHKEVKCYGRALLVALESLSIFVGYKEEISILLLGLASNNLSHFDRAFLAGAIVDIINSKQEEERKRLKLYRGELDVF